MRKKRGLEATFNSQQVLHVYKPVEMNLAGNVSLIYDFFSLTTFQPL